MAIIPRRLKSGKTAYWICLPMGDRQVWEHGGTTERGAKSREGEMRRAIKRGTFVKSAHGSRLSFGSFANEWLRQRTNRNATDDVRAVERYVLSREWLARMPVSEFDTDCMLRLIGELRTTLSVKTKKPLDEKTVRNICTTIRTLVRDALRKKVLHQDPWPLPDKTFYRRRPRARAVYDLAEVRDVVGDGVERAQVFAAIAFLTGMRQGEVCGLRWADWEPSHVILGSLRVERQYEGRPLKTEKEQGIQSRLVPVHPELARVLVAWRERFALEFLRPPRAGDPIVPARDLSHMTRGASRAMWEALLVRAKVGQKSLHSTRHTFISFCRRGDVAKDLVEKVTHNAKGDIVDGYTHLDWAPLCRVVLAWTRGARGHEGPSLDTTTTIDFPVDPRAETPARLVAPPGVEPGEGVGRNALALRSTTPNGPRHALNVPGVSGIGADVDAHQRRVLTGESELDLGPPGPGIVGARRGLANLIATDPDEAALRLAAGGDERLIPDPNEPRRR